MYKNAFNLSSFLLPKTFLYPKCLLPLNFYFTNLILYYFISIIYCFSLFLLPSFLRERKYGSLTIKLTVFIVMLYSISCNIKYITTIFELNLYCQINKCLPSAGASEGIEYFTIARIQSHKFHVCEKLYIIFQQFYNI